MYIDRGAWTRWSNGIEGGWNYKDNVFECKIDDNGSNENFSWYVRAKGPNDKYAYPQASGHEVPTFEAAEAAIDAIINFLLDGELGDYVKQMANMPKCPHCGAQVGYHIKGITATVQTTQENIDINLTLSGPHVIKIPDASCNNFNVAEVSSTPNTVWCNDCKKEITDENFIKSLPLVEKD